MDDTKKTFLEELQSLDEATKQRTLIIATVVVMLVVVYVWLGYFNSIVTSAAQPQIAQAVQASTQATSSQMTTTHATGNVSVLQNMKNGMASIYEDVGVAMNGLAHILQTPKQYIIQPNK